jgi:hypothetical protein
MGKQSSLEAEYNFSGSFNGEMIEQFHVNKYGRDEKFQLQQYQRFGKGGWIFT